MPDGKCSCISSHGLLAAVQAIAVGSLELVNLLRQEYVPALEADSTFEALLEQVVSRHFNVAPAGGTPSFISTMLDMLNSDEG